MEWIRTGRAPITEHYGERHDVYGAHKCRAIVRREASGWFRWSTYTDPVYGGAAPSLREAKEAVEDVLDRIVKNAP